MKRILVVDDDTEIRELLRDYLKNEGFLVEEAGDGVAALELAAQSNPDLMVLDIMMPKLDGFEVCKRIRQTSDVPIIFLTAKDDEIDHLLGFGFGADDYVTKPFSPKTLVARIKALLRRASGSVKNSINILHFGELEINSEAYLVKLSGIPVELTTKEFQLLKYFAERPGKVLTKRQLVTGAWGEEYFGDDAVLMVHLSHLRQKLDVDPEAVSWIRTIRGVGYKFTPKD